ncbi:MAG: ABC transporter permease [Verrucomicrobiae bacterium]|nr:ABC transporter permease [Verrucomicrobiae bacterium]
MVFYLVLLALWQIFFEMRFFPEYILPSPGMVFRRLRELGGDGILWPSVKATLLRMAIGFGLSALIGLGVGVAMGMLPVANQYLRSVFLGMQTLPSAAWVPISLLIFGLSDRGIYFVIIMSSMAAVAIATADGIANIPPLYLRAAKTLGTPRWAMGYQVILPAALPSVMTGFKLGWTLGWHGAVSAELIKSSIGLGFLLHMGRELNDMSQVLGLMLVTIFFGVLMDRFLFGVMENRIRRRWGLDHE